MFPLFDVYKPVSACCNVIGSANRKVAYIAKLPDDSWMLSSAVCFNCR